MKENGCRKTSRNSWCWTNEEDGSTHHAWNYLWSTCQQGGSGCRHIWFGCWGLPLLVGLVVSVLLDECNTSITTSHRSRAGIPSIRKPASQEIISDSVEPWDTDVSFLHIQLIGTNVPLPKIHKIPPEVDFEYSRSPAKSESWNNDPCFPLTRLSVITCVINVGNQTSKASVTSSCPFGDCSCKFVYRPENVKSTNACPNTRILKTFCGQFAIYFHAHVVTARASLFTDQRMSSLPIRAEYKHSNTICEHTFDNSPTDSSSSFLGVMVIQAKTWDFV